jgi:hypothetical protein
MSIDYPLIKMPGTRIVSDFGIVFRFLNICIYTMRYLGDETNPNRKCVCFIYTLYT